jgi:V/A-type H+-transporting ATPase subunit E
MSGITNIVKIIDSKSEERVQGILEEAELQRKDILDDAKQKSDGIQQTMIQKAEAESKAELARQEAGAKLRAKYKVLEAKENIMREILATAEENVKKQAESKDYGSILTRLAVTAGVALNTDSLELVLPKGHEKEVVVADIAKAISNELGRKVSVKISKDTVRSSGGVIVRAENGAKWIDNTFEARIERLESKVRDQVASILFE